MDYCSATTTLRKPKNRCSDATQTEQIDYFRNSLLLSETPLDNLLPPINPVPLLDRHRNRDGTMMGVRRKKTGRKKKEPGHICLELPRVLHRHAYATRLLSLGFSMVWPPPDEQLPTCYHSICCTRNKNHLIRQKAKIKESASAPTTPRRHNLNDTNIS